MLFLCNFRPAGISCGATNESALGAKSFNKVQRGKRCYNFVLVAAKGRAVL